MSRDDDIPDARDGLTRVERIVLTELAELTKDGRPVKTAMLYGRVVEKVDIGIEEFQAILGGCGGGRFFSRRGTGTGTETGTFWYIRRTVEYQPMTLAENQELAPGLFVLRFHGGEFLAGARPGQFVMLRGLDWGLDPLLPRAFSLLSSEGGEVAILVRSGGKASRLLERSQPGARFSLLGPLGRGFPEPSPERQDWLIAGGVGLAPLYMYALHAARDGHRSRVTVFYGGRSDRDLVLTAELASVSGRVELATEDGSRGSKGRVTRPLQEALAALDRTKPPPTLMVCGPEPMLEAVARIAKTADVPAYLSVEGEMACGVGACLVCAVPCHGPRPFRYACTDGPVFDLADMAGRYEDPP